MFSNAIFLITGGTGSFGNVVVKRMLGTDVSEVRIFSRDEKKQEEMRHKYRDDRLRFIVGDVRDYAAIESALVGVDYVFHAAALKQVPSCEFFPGEAIKTNVLGAENVIRASLTRAVKRVVFLSTDKAVYPINAMGLTKALMEKLVVAGARQLVKPQGKTILNCTRYGNVMASRGSVIPLFVEQLLAGQPLTITNPEMTRFLMSLDESLDLVLHAFQEGRQGDIFVQKAPACTVMDLALAISSIFDVSPEIKIIGSRHGEKLFETLISREEKVVCEDMGKYYRIPADLRGINYFSYSAESDGAIDAAIEYNSHNTERLGVDDVKAILMTLPFIQSALRGEMLNG